MAKPSEIDSESLDARYEYRVWGEHRRAGKRLSRLATNETHEKIDDCYFLVDDLAWNAKVRDNALKVKVLVSEERGFERWTSDWHRDPEHAPAPFDDLFEELRLDRPIRGKRFDLPKAVASLDDDSATRAVFVTKHRRRYRLGSIRGEVTLVDVQGVDGMLRSLAIEGDDLGDLVELRSELGLGDEPSMPMHAAIGALS